MSDEAPTPDNRPAMRASDTDRERVARILHDALGEGRLTMPELEERLDSVYAAKTLGELEPITADLPTAAPSPSDTGPAQAHTPTGVDPRIGGTPGPKVSVAVMSGASRKGDWVVPEQYNSVALMGGVDMDLRKARFERQHCTITAVAIMGGIEIVVPDDVIVEVTGIGFMGAFDSRERGPVGTPAANAPVVKVTGLAFWGGVDVVRKPRRSERHSHREIDD